MTLRKATLLLTGLGTLALLAVLLLSTRAIIDTSFLALEQAQTRKNVERAQNAVGDELLKLDETLMDWAVWDDSLLFMQGRSKDFVASNLNERTLTSLHLSAIIFLDTMGRMVIGLCSKFVLKPTPQAPFPHSPVASSPSFAPRPCCRAFGTTPGSCRDTSSTPR